MPLVGVYIYPWHTYAYDILRGISRFLAKHPDWECYLPWPGSTHEAKQPSHTLDGIIMRIGGRFDVPVDFGSTIPRVVIANTDALSTPVDIAWDNRSIGRLSGEHLLDQGHRHIVAVGHFTSSAYQRQRMEGLIDVVTGRSGTTRSIDLDVTSKKALQAILVQLPRPSAVFAVIDPIGADILRTVRQAGLRVPEDVAIVAAGDNEVFCEMTSPPLSSVALPGAEVGYLAAERLHQLLADRPRPPAIVVPPRYVTTRRSSDLLAIEDNVIARVVRFIRDRACDGLTVAEVRAKAPLSQRALEIHFKRIIGRTIEQELERVRVDRARRLLLDTDLSMADVADRAGFSSAQRLSAVFARVQGQSPSAYRGQSRGTVTPLS